MDRCESCTKPLRNLDVPRADATAGLVRSVMEDDLARLGQEEILTARTDEPAADVIGRMKQAGRSCVLVFDGDTLAGVFTERDVLRKVAGGEAQEAAAVFVSELMTPKPETLRGTDSVAAAFNRMATGRYTHVPVEKTDGTYTIVSADHLLKYIAQENW
jgi:CBS domain-containing protein